MCQHGKQKSGMISTSIKKIQAISGFMRKTPNKSILKPLLKAALCSSYISLFS